MQTMEMSDGALLGHAVAVVVLGSADGAAAGVATDGIMTVLCLA